MKTLKWVLGIALLASLIWYFFIKHEHYQIRFTSAQPPGVIYRHIQDWQVFGKNDSLDIQWESGERYSRINQKVREVENTLEYQWEMERVSDSITEIKALITDLDNYWAQKMKAPFHIGEFVSNNVKRVENVGKELLKKEEAFKVHSFADTLIPAKYCIFKSVSDIPVEKKARRMLTEISDIMIFIKSNEIELSGDPFLEVTHWNQEKNTINFNFNFPINKKDSLPANPEISFRTTTPKEFLKVEFNGNYRVSDQAWYYLMDYAERNKLEIDILPTELYLTDPHAGGNPLDWIAHILVPLK